MRIFKFEEALIEYIKRHLDILFIIAVSILGILIRFPLRNFLSDDMQVFLIGWYYQLKDNGGFTALGTQVGNYNLVYQFLIAAFTYLPVECHIMYKVLSILFDYVLATGGAVFASKIAPTKKHIPAVIYAAILLLPTVVLNSAAWGQCDSIYTAFIILSILALYEKKYVGAFVLLGISFTFKLQFIFFLPFYIWHYLNRKEYSVINFLLIPVAGWVCTLPAVIVGRRNIFDFFKVYMEQPFTDQDMVLYFPNLWALVRGDYWYTRFFAFILAVAILGVITYLLLRKGIDLSTPENFLVFASLSIWTCVEFMPGMHNRYSYPLDILLVILLSYDCKKYWKYAFLCIGISLYLYGWTLFFPEEGDAGYLLSSVLYLAGYMHFLFTAVFDIFVCDKDAEKKV